MKRARILLADDHTLTLEGICAVLEPHHEIVGMVMGHTVGHRIRRERNLGSTENCTYK